MLSLGSDAGGSTFRVKTQRRVVGGCEGEKKKSHDKTSGFERTLDQSESSGPQTRENLQLHFSEEPITTRELTSALSYSTLYTPSPECFCLLLGYFSSSFFVWP